MVIWSGRQLLHYLQQFKSKARVRPGTQSNEKQLLQIVPQLPLTGKFTESIKAWKPC